MELNLAAIIDTISKEKGLPKEVIIEAIEKAIVIASKRNYDPEEQLEARVEPKTGEIALYSVKKVVEKVQNPKAEMSLEEAIKHIPEVKIGDEVELERDIVTLGRIGAQKVRQLIAAYVAEAEREHIYEMFKNKVGDVVSGEVTHIEAGNVYFDLNKVEAILPSKEIIPGEIFRRGDRVKGLLKEIRKTKTAPQLVLSRTSPEFLKKLFYLEVPEIFEGTVVIRNAVREPGGRAKICVQTYDSNVDPVGACVGIKGTRVQAIVKELKGENIDIVPYTDDVKELIAKSLSPAEIQEIVVHDDEKRVEVTVADDQLSLAIGRKGQNVRLASKLTGWDIDIISESRLKKLKEEREDLYKQIASKKEKIQDTTEDQDKPTTEKLSE